MLDDFGESKVTVTKVELLGIVRANRDEHAKEYASAYAGYREELTSAAVRLAKTVTEWDGKAPINLSVLVAMKPPSDHTKDYDRVIRMLEMSTADTISVTERQFSNYVLDEWDWKADFIATSARYSKG